MSSELIDIKAENKEFDRKFLVTIMPLLISSIFSTAVEWGALFSNPCDRTKPPRIEKKEAKYLDEVQAATLLDLLETESTEYKTMIRLLLFTGLRRGELRRGQAAAP